jgi:hypothetical protein
MRLGHTDLFRCCEMSHLQRRRPTRPTSCSSGPEGPATLGCIQVQLTHPEPYPGFSHTMKLGDFSTLVR